MNDSVFQDWIGTRRWFFEKGIGIRTIEVVWQHRVLADAGDFDLCIHNVTFENGLSSAYFVPTMVDTGAEAIDHPAFTRWLLASLNDPQLTGGGLEWTRFGTGLPSGAAELSGSVMDVEQSNTSIRYDDSVMVKVNRRLTAGPSPEAELAPVISHAADRDFAPETFGTLWQTGALPAPTCIAICTRYVPNLGDGWAFLLERATDDPAGCLAEAATIGELTARMHMGLISDPWRTEVAPEPIRPSDTARWTSAALSNLDNLAAHIHVQGDRLEIDARALSDLLPAAIPALRDRLSGFAALVGTSQIRIHGDYHLGQILRNEDGTYVVVDFDGEPNRPLSDRRAKYSALRDVAGMLRSFAYLRGTLERNGSLGGSRAEALAWEDEMRQAYLGAYLARLRPGDFDLIPTANDDMLNALTALELEKAIYEAGYELASRPDWVALPLARLVRTR